MHLKCTCTAHAVPSPQEQAAQGCSACCCCRIRPHERALVQAAEEQKQQHGAAGLGTHRGGSQSSADLPSTHPPAAGAQADGARSWRPAQRSYLTTPLFKHTENNATRLLTAQCAAPPSSSTLSSPAARRFAAVVPAAPPPPLAVGAADAGAVLRCMVRQMRGVAAYASTRSLVAGMPADT